MHWWYSQLFGWHSSKCYPTRISGYLEYTAIIMLNLNNSASHERGNGFVSFYGCKMFLGKRYPSYIDLKWIMSQFNKFMTQWLPIKYTNHIPIFTQTFNLFPLLKRIH